MKKIFVLFFALFSLTACNDAGMFVDVEKESLKSENRALKQEISMLKSRLSSQTCSSSQEIDEDEIDLAMRAYEKVDLMLSDAVSYNKRTGRTPYSLNELGGNDYTLDGFRADINYNGPSLYRVENGRSVYRIHFIAPYASHYDQYPESRKLCDSDYKEYFSKVCGYLAGQDLSKANKNSHGYFRIALP